MSNLSKGLIEQGMAQGVVLTIINFIKSGIPQDDAFRIANANDDIKQTVLDKLKEEEDRT